MNNYHNPEIATTDKEQVEDWQKALADTVMTEWDRGRQYVDDLDDLYETLYMMLRGERPEKNYDWQSNIVINKVFQVVWTAIPYLTQKIFGANPIIGVKSFDKKGGSQREAILEFWNTMQPATDSKQMSYYIVCVMWILKALLNGVGVLKKTYHQKLKTESQKITIDIPMEIDEQGNIIKSEKFKRTLKKTFPVEDWPMNIIVNNKDIVFDWLLQPGQSIRAGRFITHRTMTDLDELHSSKINYFNLDKLDPTVNQTDSQLRQDHSTLTGMDQQDTVPDSDVYAETEVYERQGKFPVYKTKRNGQWIPCLDKEDLYGDEVVMKEMVAVVAKHDNNILIRFDENKYGEKTYIDMHIYFDAERWQSMGMVEPIKDIQTAMSDNINSVFDEIDQNLMPPVVVNKFALWDWDTMQYAPHQRWLVGGNPKDSIYFKEPSNITRDAWQRHALFDNEIQLTTITNSMAGAGKEKTATTNVLNAQMSAGKLDFLVKMIEQTGLIPSAQMDIRFAKKFVHPLTFQMILGEPFQFSEWEEIYKYIPAAASVKLDTQKEVEIQQDIQLIQILSTVQNPNTPKILNVLWGNILRNRDMPKEAALFDEDYFEPGSDAGNLQILNRMSGTTPSNQHGVEMSGQEKSVRESTYVQ